MNDGATNRPAPVEHGRVASSAAFSPDSSNHLARSEMKLWGLALFVLMVLAVGLAAISWSQVRSLAPEWLALPVGLVVLVALFGFYLLSKFREIVELRGIVRGLVQRAAAPPDLDQLEKLFGLVQRSQQGYRDLIDTFEDLLFSLSSKGEILATNRSFADLLGHPFSELVGRPLEEFVDIAGNSGQALVDKLLPRLPDQRHWSGVLQMRL